jgi:hypothetical protein
VQFPAPAFLRKIGITKCALITSVGASIARPPKIKEFRILKGVMDGFRLTAIDFAEQNLRTSDARPYIQKRA